VTLMTLARADRRVMFDPLLSEPMLSDLNFSGRSEDA
jgi:hypothetical protein